VVEGRKKRGEKRIVGSALIKMKLEKSMA